MLNFLFARGRVTLTGLMFVGASALALFPTWVQSVGADVWNLPSDEASIRENARANDRITQQNDETLRRIAIKESIVEELLAGRLTLAEATDQFVEMNAARPECLNRIRAEYPGSGDREKTARNVISFAIVHTKPAERAGVQLRLERELQRMLGQPAGA